MERSSTRGAGGGAPAGLAWTRTGAVAAYDIPQQRTEAPAARHRAAGAPMPLDRSWLDATLSALVRTHHVPGAQLAVHHGDTTLAAQAGELEHGAGTRVTPDTAFPIGSISKSFTATVAMILVADGDAELDAPLGEHVRELDDLTGRLTLRQVLSHTSGLASGPGSAEASDVSLRRYLSEHCRHPMVLLPPGTSFSYSNMGFLVVGRLIETITGMSWYEAMESILLRPLGIEPAFIGTATRHLSGRPIATGHSVNTTVGRTRPVRQSQAPAEAPAGALALSALDLARFAQLHVGAGRPGVLSVTDAARMRQAVPAADPFGIADGWGLGLAVFRAKDTDWVGHDGNADGTSCYFRVDPVSGCIVALTTNANTGHSLWEDLLVELRQVGVCIRPESFEAAPAASIAPPPGYAGRYSNGYTDYVLASDDDEGLLCLFVDNKLSARLAFYDDTHFTLRDPGSGHGSQLGRLVRDPITGEPDHLQIGGRIAHRQASVMDCLAS